MRQLGSCDKRSDVTRSVPTINASTRAACPSRAIVFGDAADQAWSVNRGITDERAYHVFEELNTYTAVVYLKKVNHPGAGAATMTAAPAARRAH